MTETKIEVWLPVRDYESQYEVSNLGNLRSLRRGLLMLPGVSHGYSHVTLVDGFGVRRNHRVHILVLTAFCGPRPFDGAHGAHNDGDQTNNALTNLRWASAVENQADVKRHGRRICGTDVHGAKLVDRDIELIRKRLATGEKYSTIADDFGVSISTISLIKRDRIWRHVP